MFGAEDDEPIPHLDDVNGNPIERAEPLARQDLAGSPDGPSAPYEIQDPIHIRQYGVHLVGDEDDRSSVAAPPLVDELCDGVLASQVQCQQRLITEQDPRIPEQRLSDPQALLFAS